MSIGQETVHRPDEAARDAAFAVQIGPEKSLSGSTEAADQTPEPLPISALRREIWEGCWASGEWTLLAVLRLFAVFCIAALCSWAGIWLARQSEGVATIWLSNGVVLGFLITQSPRRWLPYFSAGLLADILADLVWGDPFRVAIGVSFANSLEVVISALVLARLFGAPVDLAKRRPLVGFMAVSVLGATAMTSALGVSWLSLVVRPEHWGQMFRTWWLGDMLGMAILVPLTVMLQRPLAFSIFRPGQLHHTALVLAAPLLATLVIFTHGPDPLIFLLFPALLLVAFRLGFPGTVLTIVLVTIMVIGLTVKGYGPLMLITGQQAVLQRIVVAQIFAAVSIFTLFPVAALLEEKDVLQRSLQVSEARYRLLAQTDELTRLANRRAFNVRLAAEWETAVREGQRVALLLIDADHFKQYNDVFGHLQGDLCLQRLAAILSAAVLHRNALTARFGGEEFAVLLPGADASTAQSVAEQIRVAVLAEALPHPTGPQGVQTVSVGAAATAPIAGDPSAGLVKRADEALYCAKLAGRNQVAVL